MGNYKVLDGALTLLNKENIPRPTEDPFWLTSAMPKLKKGKSICDVGSGIGIISLIIAYNNKQSCITGYEINDELTKVAKQNSKFNNIGNCLFETRDILTNLPEQLFDHVVSNPPYHNTDKGFTSTNSNKKLAHGSNTEQIQQWIKACIKLTKLGGTCTIIHHSQNITILKPILNKYKHSITSIQTKLNKPAKRVIISINV